MSENKELIFKAVKEGLPKAKNTSIWLLKLILPISLLVQLLQFSGLLNYVAIALNPVFQTVGLPGTTSIAFVCSVFLPLYAPVAIATSIGLTVRQMTILAIMCLISHNVFVETAVQKRTGSPYFFILFLRIGMSFVAAFIWNLMLPENMGTTVRVAVDSGAGQTIWNVLMVWAQSSLSLSIKMIVIVTVLMVLQRILVEFNIMDAMARFFAPFMRFMGLSRDCSFLWLVAYIVGLTYGSAIMFEEVEAGKLSLKDTRTLNYHLAISHSFLEDTFIWVAVGASLFWVTVPRLLLAITVVWIIKLFSKFFSKFQKA